MRQIYSIFILFFLYLYTSGCTANFSNPKNKLHTVQGTTNIDTLLIKSNDFQNITILNQLLKGDLIESLNMMKWQAFPGEDVLHSFNGFCYSNIDTIHYFNNTNTKNALVVFRTIQLTNEESEMQSNADKADFGIALFQKNNDSWKLIKFDPSILRIGNFGSIPPNKILPLHPNESSLFICEEENKDSDCYSYIISLQPDNFGKELLSFPHFKMIEYSDEDGIKIETSTLTINQDFKVIEPTLWSYPSITVKTALILHLNDTETLLNSSTTNYQFEHHKYYLNGTKRN